MGTQKYCAAFPCPNLVPKGEIYCPDHRRESQPRQHKNWDQGRGTEKKLTEPFYGTARWKRFRNWYIARHPLCEICETEGRTTAGVLVDHIVELRDGGAELDPDNVQTLCSRCHARKTTTERKKRGPKVYSY